jgi:hypothetical protein
MAERAALKRKQDEYVQLREEERRNRMREAKYVAVR